MKIKELFGNARVVGIAGEKSSGKTNNIIALIEDFRKNNSETPIYVYGFDHRALSWLKNMGNVYEFSSINHLSGKQDSLIIVDEFQKLNLNNKRYKAKLDALIDFIYHDNNWLILSSPGLREFNSIIGGKVERWALKNVRVANLVNGSQLKEAVVSYNGRFKSIDDLHIPKDTLLVINEDYEKLIELRYIPEVDFKQGNIDIFKVEEKVKKKSKKKSE